MVIRTAVRYTETNGTATIDATPTTHTTPTTTER